MALQPPVELFDGDPESILIFNNSIGRTIKDLGIIDNYLFFMFDDNSGMHLSDSEQNCCEERYMHTDDDLQYFTGAILQGAEVRLGPEEDGCGIYKESQFLSISTSKGQFTVVNYNIHNGYYGGFSIEASNTEG